MKSASLMVAATLVSGLAACGSGAEPVSTGAGQDLSADTADASDACRAPALAAAEQTYGNDPVKTSVHQLTRGVKYYVVVGIGNDEDGAHDYWVTFPDGCSSTPTVEEVPEVPNPLRDAAHDAYDQILWANGDVLPDSNAVAEDQLPAAAKTVYEQYASEPSACSKATAYQVEVSGEDTFAVGCNVIGDSVIFDLAVYDSTGKAIDDASTYGVQSSVGDQGVSWRNLVFEVPSN